MIKDRVIEFRRVRAGDLVPHPDNWREHPKEQRQAYASILEDIGFAGAILTRLMDDGRLQIIDGHMRSDYSPDIELPCVVTDLTVDEADKALVSFDPLALMARTNADKLEALHARIHTDHEGLRETLAQMAADAGIELQQDEPPEAPEAQIDRAGELQREWQTELGQLWEIPSMTGKGVHRVLCGDSTNADDVGRLMGGVKAEMVHADPPYGMGKENDGIANDNLYNEKLDRFQIAWLTQFIKHTELNSSFYVWGTAPNLWRLWYCGGLRDIDRLTIRNEIVWNKGSGQGMGSNLIRSYAIGSERCLFFMRGDQEFSTNADNYWDGWDSIRLYLKSQVELMGWDIPTMKRIVGHSDLSSDHWTSKSQWSMPTRDVYEAWQKAAKPDAFKREYDEIKREYDEIKREYDEKRAYFDNTHDLMTDVWDYSRVIGADRWGHATPKPIDMITRIVKSSSRKYNTISEPFLGSGTTLIAAEQTGRICYGMELEPAYIAVTLQRAKDMGLKPRLVNQDTKV